MKADRIAIATLVTALALGCGDDGAGRAGPAPRREGGPEAAVPGVPVDPSPEGARPPSRDAGSKQDG